MGEKLYVLNSKLAVSVSYIKQFFWIGEGLKCQRNIFIKIFNYCNTCNNKKEESTNHRSH